MKYFLMPLKIVSSLLTLCGLWIYTSITGLHFIALYIISAIILFLGIIFYELSVFNNLGRKYKQLSLSFLVTSVLISLPMIIGNPQDKMIILLGIISSSISFVIFLFGIRFILKK